MGDQREWTMPGTKLIAHDPDDGCARCPLFGNGLCRAEPRGIMEFKRGVGPSPAWCPLRKGGVLVSSRTMLAKVFGAPSASHHGIRLASGGVVWARLTHDHRLVWTGGTVHGTTLAQKGYETTLIAAERLVRVLEQFDCQPRSEATRLVGEHMRLQGLSLPEGWTVESDG